MTTTPRNGDEDGPPLPSGRITLRAPPEVEPGEGAAGVLATAVPMLGSLGTIAIVTTTGSAAPGRSYVAAGSFLVATLALVVVQLDRQRRQRTRRVTGARAGYLGHLATVRRAARDAADQQRRALAWRHPDPVVLPVLSGERSRVWERSRGSQRSLRARYGVGAGPLAVELVPPESSHQADPVAASALARLLAVHGDQPGLPRTVDLLAHRRIVLSGPADRCRALARAVVCSATAFHGPDDLLLAVLTTPADLPHWEWVKWLPHAQSTRQSDALRPRRMVATSRAEIRDLLPCGLVEQPGPGDEGAPAPGPGHALLVLDGVRDRPHTGTGVTVLELGTVPEEPEVGDPGTLRLEVGTGPPQDGRPPVVVVPAGGEPVPAHADQCDPATAEAFARRLAPLTGDASPTGSPTPDVLDLWGIGDLGSREPAAGWRHRADRERLRVAIGSDDRGALVHLDLKESAQQGMGPHGLVVGATGSGKSELLRTLVLGLATTHGPDQLNMVLVDFKGGATFAGMAALPHVSAVITNLARELALVDRMQDALSGEMVRRQELLRAAGNLASVRDHEQARVAGADLPALPSLFVVVDEFSEMLTAKPELLDLFVAIGRLGRSLGLHLLLASQRLDEGRLRGLESHLSYRIGLRTFSAADSRAVIGTPDAYELPPVPGVGYLRTDRSTLLRFSAAYVSGPAAPRGAHRANGRSWILPFTAAEVRAPAPADPPTTGEGRESVLDVAVARMAGHGPAAHRVWLPPLDVPETLDVLLGDLVEDPSLGLVSPRWRRRRAIPVGIVDRPREQRRETLELDLGGESGQVAVVGGPRSGKSTLLRTIVTAVALTTTPLESQVFVLDFGGGGFLPLAGLPHVAGIGTRAEPDVVRRILAEVRGIVDRREAYFRAEHIDSIETYRERRAAGRADDGYGDVFLVVDGWATLRADFDDAELELQQLASRGLALGVHLLVGAARWADVRTGMRDLLGTRLELRLGDPFDSEVDRRAAAQVPTGHPGRGLTRGGLHHLTALPRIDARPDAPSLALGVDDLVARVRAAWPGPTGPKLRLLPDRVGLEAVRVRAEKADRDPRLMLLGIDEADLAPVGLDPDAEPHLLVLGDSGSGKSALLRSYVHEVVRTRTADQAQLVVLDPRRSLQGEVPDPYLLHHLTSAAQAQPAFGELASYLESRLPGPDVTPAQLRARSWWTGAEVFVLVDDYDLVAAQQPSPVQALVPMLAQARDVGLHLVVARRAGGAARALYEPVLQSLRDLAAPGLLLSGHPEEGPLIGNLRPALSPPGRGRLVSRDHGTRVVQTAWTDPTY